MTTDQYTTCTEAHRGQNIEKGRKREQASQRPRRLFPSEDIGDSSIARAATIVRAPRTIRSRQPLLLFGVYYAIHVVPHRPLGTETLRSTDIAVLVSLNKQL